MLWIAITPFVKPDAAVIETIIKQAAVVDRILLRLDVNHEELMAVLAALVKRVPKAQLIVHSDIPALKHYHLTSIHFKEGDKNAYAFKLTHPEVTVSMAVHSAVSCRQAKAWQLDFGLFSPLFATPSKPGQPPRTDKEINSALETNFPLVALGGIDNRTIDFVPKGFIGIAAIRLFQQEISLVQQLREERSLRNTIF